jgi:hypothetical protein
VAAIDAELKGRKDEHAELAPPAATFWSTHAADVRQGYGDVGRRVPNEAFARHLIEAHARAGVEVMAVSDHNRVDWYPALRQVGDEDTAGRGP